MIIHVVDMLMSYTFGYLICQMGLCTSQVFKVCSFPRNLILDIIGNTLLMAQSCFNQPWIYKGFNCRFDCHPCLGLGCQNSRLPSCFSRVRLVPGRGGLADGCFPAGWRHGSGMGLGINDVKRSTHPNPEKYPPGNQHISYPKALLKMMFLFPRWDMFVP